MSPPNYHRRPRSYSGRAIRTWCAPLSVRWQIPLEDLFRTTYECPDLVPDPVSIDANLASLRRMAAGLDALMGAELQWNFWYRPSVVNPLAPMCRLRWERGALAAFADEVEALIQAATLDPLVCVGPFGALRLFKPATMFRRLEGGYAVTHVVCERRPERLPYSFGPHQTAPWKAGPPANARLGRTR